MVGFEQNERPRPQFEGVLMKSPVNGKPELYFPEEDRSTV